MEYLNEKLPEWKITHQFMQALNSKWDHVTLALQAQKGIKDITLEELVANLQSQAGITERKMARRQSDKSHAIALKVEKALDLAHGNESPKEDDDIALLTKALKMANFGKSKRDFRAGGSRGNFSKGNRGATSSEDKGKSKEREDRICYHCQKKGHLSKDCYSRKKGEEPAPKPAHAMFAAWGDSDEDSDDGKCSKEPCLMAHSTANEVTDTDSMIDEVFTESDFAETITKLLEKIRNLENRISSMQQEHQDDLEENHLWSTKAMRLEKEMAEHVCKCLTCARKERQINKLSEELKCMSIGNTEIVDFNTKVEELERELVNHKQNNEELLHIVAELRCEEAVKREKWLRELEAKRIEEEKENFKRTFAKPGLGYEEEDAKGMNTKGKSVMLDSGESSRQNRRTQTIRQTRRETSPQEGLNIRDKDSVPYKARKAYKIWLKMSQNRKPSKTDFHARKVRTSIPPGRSKYVDLPCHRSCWHCGQSGHYRAECPRLREIDERNRTWVRAEDHHSVAHYQKKASAYWNKGRARLLRPHYDPEIRGKPRNAPRRKIGTTNHYAQYQSYYIPVDRFVPKPSKPKLIWVRKN